MSAVVLPETSEWRTVELEDNNPLSGTSVSGSSKQQQHNIHNANFALIFADVPAINDRCAYLLKTG